MSRIDAILSRLDELDAIPAWEANLARSISTEREQLLAELALHVR